MGELQRQLVVPFSPQSRDGPPLAIIPDPGFYADALVHLLLLPDVQAGLKAHPGFAVLGNSKVIDIPAGVLQVSDSDSASLPAAPSGTAPQFEALFAFNSEGDTTTGAHWDPVSFQVKLSRRCSAVIAYTAYKASARMITYTPKVESSPAGGSRTIYGVVVARYQGALVTYQVSPPTIDLGEAVVELYKRASSKIINADGQFEKPPGYPQVGTYPGKSFVLDVVGSREIERVHEVGFINRAGRVQVYTPSVTILEPYVGDGAYAPTVACSIATLDPALYPKDVIAGAQDFIRSKGLGCKDG